MSGAKFQVGDTVRYTKGYGEPIGVVRERFFDPELMWWVYRVFFNKDDNAYKINDTFTMLIAEGNLSPVKQEEADKVPFTHEEAEVPEHFDEHYQGDVQPIELMQSAMSKEAFMGFLRGNIIKYACRLGKKDDVAKETTKILRYAQWLHEVAQGKKIDPRV